MKGPTFFNKNSPMKQEHNVNVESTTNGIDMQNLSAEERRLLMEGYKRQAEQRKAEREKTKKKQNEPSQREKDLEFVKSSTNTILKGEDPISQAFSLVAGGGLGGQLSKVAQARNLPIVKKTIDVLGKVKKAKTLGS